MSSQRLYIALAVFTAAIVNLPVLADSNASGGAITNSETVDLGAGPFDHGAAPGDASNTVVAGVSFTGGFSHSLCRNRDLGDRWILGL